MKTEQTILFLQLIKTLAIITYHKYPVSMPYVLS